ncbi:hypothetical protein Agub_g11138 [Astrephomene gubernaculifera]|uniref:Uncharacterized protein n=1 Tax=Astrephomene gubernaculifera TaxID=47775 RepID=A0AAD3HQT2_9CHLO|nr:hypothetical protein Agub_g11138 [Astrephomene gubernaculifera]
MPSISTECACEEHVQDWRDVVLRPAIEPQSPPPVDLDLVTDTFIALRNDEPDEWPDYDYYLMYYKYKMEVRDSFTDADGKKFPDGAEIVNGRWLLLSGQHLKFTMDRRYKLSAALQSDVIMTNVGVQVAGKYYSITEAAHEVILQKLKEMTGTRRV